MRGANLHVYSFQILVVLVLNTLFSRPIAINIRFQPLALLLASSAWYLLMELLCLCDASSTMNLCQMSHGKTSTFAVAFALASHFVWVVFRSHVAHVRCSHLLDGVRRVDGTLVGLVVGTLLHAGLQGSSSFVEEEHQTWYCWLVTLLLMLAWRDVRERWRLEHVRCLSPALGLGPDVTSRNIEAELGKWPLVLRCCFEQRRELGWILVLSMVAAIRRLNQTGDKWLSVPDVSDWLVNDANRGWLSVWTGVCKYPII